MHIPFVKSVLTGNPCVVSTTITVAINVCNSFCFPNDFIVIQ